jgi:DNA-binding MltR family transcriptional regulator
MSADATRDDLINESDRGCVIVGAALLEDDLAEALKRRFKAHGVSKKHIEEMFSLNGPLATFHSKCLISYGFDLISKTIYDDLCKIRRLRNKFAHSPSAVDFLDPEVEDCVADMQCCIEAAKRYEGKMLKGRKRSDASRTGGDSQLSDWEARSMGFVKYTKSVFCVGVYVLRIQMATYLSARET